MVKAAWHLLPADLAAVEAVSRDLHLPRGIAQVLVARGITRAEEAERFLDKSMAGMVSPFELAGMEGASDRVAEAILNGEKVLVHGDFDADGISAAAMLTLFLSDLGAPVIPFVPNRLEESHGISSRALEMARQEKVGLVITCDCGSSSQREIAALAEAGIETVVTDHHEIPENFSHATHLVNPKRSGEGSLHEGLSGAGVTFMLAVAIRAKLRDRGFFAQREEPNLKEYLDIVALGTVADMAPLVGQNRILVDFGLRQLALSCRPSIRALREQSRLTDPVLTATDVAFRLAPRINAAARLGHAQEALDLFLARDEEGALERAKKLESLNEERKALQIRMERVADGEASAQVRSGQRVIVVSSPDFHPGVVGLLAQKLLKTYGRPAFAFALEGEEARGSGRAQFPINLVELLGSVEDLVESHGGHKEAAGCRLPRANLSAFTERVQREMEGFKEVEAKALTVDAPLGLDELSFPLLSALDGLGPFGIGNPEPVFISPARVVGTPKEVGRDHVRVQLKHGGSPVYSAIGFRLWQELRGILSGEIEVAYIPERSNWNGRSELRVRLSDARRPRSS